MEIKQSKPRPAAVVASSTEFGYELVIQVTSKNRSKTNKGIWVLKNLPEGKAMGIFCDSFINIYNCMLIHIG